jgi:hypothetical protein
MLKNTQDSLMPKNTDPKKFTPVSGKAIVYVVRPTLFGFAVQQDLSFPIHCSTEFQLIKGCRE